MPNWNPDWNNVHWNHAASEAAVSALRRAAILLRQTREDREGAAQRAVEEWRGPHRETFDSYRNTTRQRSLELADAYDAAARQIQVKSEEAIRERRHREEERERWHREKDAEEQAMRTTA